ncbi:hypothetical protein [Ensifer sp.]|uniref:hypothetical protein n=1 Tax=Ensifer sp. TaxID=1872086 RepID=UPI002E0F2C79|nr:hypothetical protein [Ensifer sp.]
MSGRDAGFGAIGRGGDRRFIVAQGANGLKTKHKTPPICRGSPSGRCAIVGLSTGGMVRDMPNLFTTSDLEVIRHQHEEWCRETNTDPNSRSGVAMAHTLLARYSGAPARSNEPDEARPAERRKHASK